MTTVRSYLSRGLGLWLVASLLSCALLYAEQIRRQYWQFDREFSALFSRISTVLTQNEAVLPLLNGDEPPGELQKKLPQIAALERTQARPLDGERVEAIAPLRYWLYNPYRQIRVQIDLNPLFHAPSSFSRVALDIGTRTVADGHRWQWARTFSQHFQPFTLQASAEPDWTGVARWPFAVVILGWGIVVGTGTLLLWQRRQQRNARQRADYYQHTRLSSLNEITAGVVHEINQPLTAAQMWLKGGERQLNNGNTDEALQALRAAMVQTRRIDELLTRFRAHMSQESVTLTPVSLAASWQRVGNLLEHEPGAKQIRITHDFVAPLVLADRLWLEQVLHNLLNNAIQAKVSHVHIQSQPQGEQVRVILTDDGPGFSPEALQQALMPFYSERSGGMGLGMTLVESLMTRMNGSIRLANHPGGGAEIVLMFTRGDAAQ